MDPENEQQPNTEQQPEQASDEQRMAAFEAGLKLERPTETPVEPVPQDEPQAAAPAAPAPEYVQITREDWTALQARAAQVEDLRSTLEKSNGTAFGKIGGLERQIKELASNSSAPVFDISDEEIADLKGDFPGLAGVLDKVRKAKPVTVDEESIVRAVQERLTQQQPDPVQAVEIARRAWREEALSEVHPDWREVGNSADFQAYAAQTGVADEVLKAANAWDHRTMAKHLSAFKDARKRTTDAAAARRARVDSNVNPRGTAAAAQQPPSSDEAFTAGLRKVGINR
jgi:hypothetical protein